ncbi:MAG: hypothetical protein FWE61_00955 [Micrococcales bacterium]|nr:hypothetical protein [Micrococcales bacterium]
MLTGETPGPQHGSGWVPGGLAAAGDMVRAVVAGLCAPDPRQRLTLPAAFATMAPALGPAQAVVPPPVVPTAGPAVPPAPPVGPVPGVVPVQGQVPMAPAGHVAAVPGAQVPVAPAPVGPPAPVPVAPVQVPVAPGPVVPVVQPVQPPVVPAGPGPAAQAPGAPVAPAVVPSGPAPGVPGQADAPGGSAWGTAESARWAGWSTPAIASTPAAEAPAPDDPPVRPASSRRRRAVVVMASVTVVFTALAAVVWGVSAATGRIGAIASPTPTRDRPTSTGPAHTGPEYVVWDGGDNLVLGEQAHTPTHVFVSQDQLPRTITCAPEGEAGSTHVTVDVDPLLLTDDVEVALEVGSACRVNLSVPTGLNFTIDWTGIRAAAGVPAAFIAVDFSDSATHLGVGHEVYDHIADADQPVLHLKVHAEGELYTWPSYTKWSDGRSVFGVPDRTFVRYWFPTTGQMPRSVTCTKTPVTGLDFRRAKLTADVEVPIDVADGCTSTTLLVSAEQNWTIEWTGKGAGVLDVVDGTGVAAQRLNTGTKTLSNTPHPGQPTVRLVVTSTTLVHVTPDRAVY